VGKEFVASDDELADRLFIAGMELARETGVYCLDTKRRMIWSQGELEEVIRTSPSHVTLGDGEDKVLIQARRPEQNSRVAVCGGPYGIQLKEENFVPIMFSYAQEPLIDFIDNGSLISTYGRTIRAASPWEAVACWQEADSHLR
jgi:methylamine--corrinoid protein Co-methyltransferase